jgi:hypothetical protein
VHSFSGWHAAGGIFDRPSVIGVGEAGPEALLPLDSFQDVVDSMHELNETMKALSDNPGFNMGSGYSGRSGGGGGSSSNFTEYGPAIDPIGSRDYDSDSYHGTGHINGVPYNLNSEASGTPTAMKSSYARSHYGIKPGSWYKSDKDGKQHRWMDTTGSQNPQNEDVYKNKGASINYSPTYHVNVLDASSMREVLETHGREMHRHLRALDSDDAGRMAVV